MDITLFRLITAAMLPIVVAAGFYHADRHGRFAHLNYWLKQTIIGISFGIIAILATEFGIPYDGAVANVRSAAPLTAGLIFGWPAGIISGLVGGVERWFSRAGDYTRMACTIGTFIAGFMGASIRRFMMDNKKATWFYGLAVGVTCEVLHMLMVFIFNTDDIYRAFEVVRKCAIPMITFNGLSVMMAIVVIASMSKKKEAKGSQKLRISQTFQRWLLISVLLAFSVTMLFTNNFQNILAYANADRLLKQSIEDVQSDIIEASDAAMLNLTHKIKDSLPEEYSRTVLQWIKRQYDIGEIHVVDENGIITVSSNPEYEGFDFASGEQSAEFLCLLNGATEYVQSYQPISFDASISRKYAGVVLEGGGFLQIGYDRTHFQNAINQQILVVAKNRHIGQNGCIIICNEQGVIISDRDGHEGESISLLGDLDGTGAEEFTRYRTEIYGADSFCMYSQTEGYYIVAVLPAVEAMFSRDVAVYILAFMETLVFAALFVIIFVLIKRLIVENIRRINESLSQITKGNLDVMIDVRDNAEFASLSDDINSTVATLKLYIAEAAARFDKDLEIAKLIQHSSLPSVFPPYPHRRDFNVFASMDAAKEVGGDFYDFYLLDEKHLAFLIADVSGKGIPAAMFMMTSKTLIKNYAESGLPVHEIFSRVNSQLCENNEAGMFVTAWMGILDIETGLIRYANAGHNPPVVKCKNGSYEYLKGRANLVLGGMSGVRYREQQVQLQPGDEIYLYTDGVTEAHNVDNQLFGEDRLLQSLNEAASLSVEQICKKVKADVDAFADEKEQFDDITMLCVRLEETGDKRVLNFEPVMESMTEVSAFVETQLEELGVPLKIQTKLMVAVDEICSNIVRYSGAASAQISIEKAGDTLQVVFRDNGKPYNPLDNEEPDITASAEDRSIGGLGIFMVRKMMDRVEYMFKDDQNVLTLMKRI